MKIGKWVVPTKSQWLIVDVRCDLCRKSVKIPAGRSWTRGKTGRFDRYVKMFAREYADIKIFWGYYSKGKNGSKDGCCENTQLCCKCWEKCRAVLEKLGVKFRDYDYLENTPENAPDADDDIIIKPPKKRKSRARKS